MALQAEPELLRHTVVAGPINGDWWRLFTYQFAYFEGGGGGLYAFVAILATGLFGWLVERRHGPAVVLALFLGAGALGALAPTPSTRDPFLAGANAGALALLAAGRRPTCGRCAAASYYEGDLLGAGAFAALLLAIPFAAPRPAGWPA